MTELWRGLKRNEFRAQDALQLPGSQLRIPGKIKIACCFGLALAAAFRATSSVGEALGHLPENVGRCQRPGGTSPLGAVSLVVESCGLVIPG